MFWENQLLSGYYFLSLFQALHKWSFTSFSHFHTFHPCETSSRLPSTPWWSENNPVKVTTDFQWTIQWYFPSPSWSALFPRFCENMYFRFFPKLSFHCSSRSWVILIAQGPILFLWTVPICIFFGGLLCILMVSVSTWLPMTSIRLGNFYYSVFLLFPSFFVVVVEHIHQFFKKCHCLYFPVLKFLLYSSLLSSISLLRCLIFFVCLKNVYNCLWKHF